MNAAKFGETPHTAIPSQASYEEGVETQRLLPYRSSEGKERVQTTNTIPQLYGSSESCSGTLIRRTGFDSLTAYQLEKTLMNIEYYEDEVRYHKRYFYLGIFVIVFMIILPVIVGDWFLFVWSFILAGNCFLAFWRYVEYQKMQR